MKEPKDIDPAAVERLLQRHEQDAVDAEFDKFPGRPDTLELCLLALIAFVSVGIISYAFCEMIRLVRTHGF